MMNFYFFSLLLLSVFHGTQGDCSARPATLNGNWLVGYVPNPTYDELLFSITDDAVTITNTQTTATERSYTCESFHTSPPLEFAVRQDQSNVQECVQFYIPPSGNFLLQRTKEMTGTNNVASSCSPQFTGHTPDAFVMPDHPTSAHSPSECPFNEGIFHAYYSDIDVVENCKTATASKVTINANTIVMDTCFSNLPSYQEPYAAMTLSCMDYVSPTVLSLNQNSGEILLLRSTAPGDASKDIFYCVRFLVNNTADTLGQMFLSFSVGQIGFTYCPTEQTYSSYGNGTQGHESGWNQYFSMVLTPDECGQLQPCLNGGTCNQGWGSYTCSCVAGFTGTHCETDIDECASSPCMNGGTCNDGINRFTCNCVPDVYYGTVCEFHHCNLTDEWQANPWILEYPDSTITFDNSDTLTIADGSTMDYSCKTDAANNGFTVFSVWKDEDTPMMYDDVPEWYTCWEAVLVTDVFFQRHGEPINSTELISGSDCITDLGARQSLGVSLSSTASYQGDASGSCANFPQSTFQVTYQVGAGTPECVNNETSTAEILGDQIRLDSCTTTDDYGEPANSNLVCVEDMPATALDPSASAGDRILIFAVERSVGEYSVYCARYKVAGIQILLSLNANDESWPVCELSADATTVDAGYVAFTLTSNLCDADPCLNGGTCTDLMADFTCACAAGFTGTRCETNIDECASNPCQNGGTCDHKDDIAGYECLCTLDWYGTHCENPACQFPEELTGSAGNVQDWWVRYTNATKSQEMDLMSYNPVDIKETSIEYMGSTTTSSFCEDYQTGGSVTTFSAFVKSGANDQKSCTGVTVFDYSLLTRRDDLGSRTTKVVASVCNTMLDTINDYDVYVKHPFAYLPPSSGNCPFPNARYQTVFTWGGSTNCRDDEASHSMVSGRRVTVNSCSTATGTYTLPLNGSELYCLDTLPKNTFGWSSDGLVLAYKDPDALDLYSFYCAKFEIVGIQVILSLNVISDKNTTCKNGRTPTSASDEDLALVLTSDECHSNPCQHGGTCEDLLAAFRCWCTDVWMGVFCDIPVDDCDPDPCQNGGTCRDQIGGFVCTCLDHYSGTFCEVFDHCHSNPCQNDGTCRNEPNQYKCTCHPGYSGIDCEIDVDECASNPCENGGTCTDGVNSFTCTCVPGFTNAHCEVNIDECLSQPCLNGGTCEDEVLGWYCRCPSDYSGVNCEHVNECGSNPCQNGGICKDHLHYYTCRCPIRYEGVNCESDVFSATTANLTTRIEIIFLNDFTIAINGSEAAFERAMSISISTFLRILPSRMPEMDAVDGSTKLIFHILTGGPRDETPENLAQFLENALRNGDLVLLDSAGNDLIFSRMSTIADVCYGVICGESRQCNSNDGKCECITGAVGDGCGEEEEEEEGSGGEETEETEETEEGYELDGVGIAIIVLCVVLVVAIMILFPLYIYKQRAATAKSGDPEGINGSVLGSALSWYADYKNGGTLGRR